MPQGGHGGNPVAALQFLKGSLGYFTLLKLA